MSTPPRTVGWGILGSGHMAQVFAHDLHLAEGAELRAVTSRTSERAQEFAAQVGARPVVGLDALAADPEIDVVYVATPAAFHRDHCLALLAAGKHILCEKPFTLDAAQAREVAAAARANGLFCMEAMWMRFHPGIRRARELVENGSLGEVRTVCASFGYPGEDPSWSLRYAGALLECGVYPISLACHLLGRPDQVAGVLVPAPTGGADVEASVSLRFPEGAVASLFASVRSLAPNEALIAGSLGVMRIHAPFYRPRQISITATPPLRSEPAAGPRKRSDLERWIREQRLAVWGARTARHAQSHMRTKRATFPVLGAGYAAQAIEVMSCVREQQTESSIMPLDDTIAVMEISDAVRIGHAITAS